MNFKALEAELEGDLERLAKPKRGRKKADAELAAHAPMGPGRHEVLGSGLVEFETTVYLDPDGVVRERARLPGGAYAVVAEREATPDELALAEAPERARALRPAVERLPLEVGSGNGEGEP